MHFLIEKELAGRETSHSKVYSSDESGEDDIAFNLFDDEDEMPQSSFFKYARKFLIVYDIFNTFKLIGIYFYQ